MYFIAGEVTQPQIRVIMGRLTKLAAIVWKMNTLAPEVNATKHSSLLLVLLAERLEYLVPANLYACLVFVI